MENINMNLSIARESNFNRRYNDYKNRIKEVNKAKEILRNNKSTMSDQVKARMIEHIKHKMQIVSLIE